ncbi:MAG TPA: hypothetical protein PLU25_10680, partial [Acidobacteriota bacterium]|nr:hypothetical protein [Acidobacteriota bacterium]
MAIMMSTLLTPVVDAQVRATDCTSDASVGQFIGLMNDLSDAMSQKKGKEAMERTLKGLLEYTVTHFSHEEKLF